MFAAHLQFLDKICIPAEDLVSGAAACGEGAAQDLAQSSKRPAEGSHGLPSLYAANEQFQQKAREPRRSGRTLRRPLHVDAEFRRWCRCIGISESEIARLVSETAVDESAERPAAVRARRE